MIDLSPTLSDWESLLRTCVVHSLERVSSEVLSRTPIVYRDKLIVPPREWPVRGKVHVVGWGKAALPVVEHVWESVAADRRGTSICVQGRAGWLGSIELLAGEHPVPGPGSFAAGRRILALFQSVSKTDIVIAVSSGGGSAMLALPAEGVRPEDKSQLNRILLSSGLSGRELGLVRARVSAIKGGGLASVFQGDLLVTLVVSDHVEALGDLAEAACFVASGPTGAPVTTGLDRVLEKIDLNALPVSIRERLTCPRPTREGGPCAGIPRHDVVLADNRTLKEALRESLRLLGVEAVYMRRAPFQAPTKRLAAELVSECLAVNPRGRGVMAYVAGGETVLKHTGGGQGGRCQDLAARMVRELSPDGCFAAVAFGSDGVDNVPGIAGALATLPMRKRYLESPDRFETFIDAYETLRLHEEVGTLVRSPATCCHVGEAVVILRRVGNG